MQIIFRTLLNFESLRLIILDYTCLTYNLIKKRICANIYLHLKLAAFFQERRRENKNNLIIKLIKICLNLRNKFYSLLTLMIAVFFSISSVLSSYIKIDYANIHYFKIFTIFVLKSIF